MIMAGAAQLNGELETASRLLGAVHGVGMASNPFMADLVEQASEALRAALGSDELARLLLEGESTDFDEAADLGAAFLAMASGGA